MDVNMLLIVEKGIRVHAMPYVGMQKPTTSTWKTMTQSKNHHTSCTRMSTTYMDRLCHGNSLQIVSNSETTNLDENSDKRYISEVDVD